MMQRLFIVISVSIATCAFSADDPALKAAAGEKQLDGAATDKLLAQIAERFKKSPSIKAKILTEVDDLVGKRSEEGELLLDRPSRVMRKFTKPSQKIWVLNETYIQEYLPNRKTLYTKDFSKAPQTLSLLQSAVTLDVKALTGLFNIGVFESTKENARSYRLLLTPKADTKQPVPYKRIQARIGETGLFFHEIEYVPESGDATVEKYSDIQAVEKPKEDAFVFEVPQDVKRKTDVIAADADKK
ncbi:MAG TPA: outer membrane lipoprotein carrier protein LolA [Planctomycetota bacterium]|nr:outer membrane lipoprotein carrier protein LolA [Planctomycetota bacterium]